MVSLADLHKLRLAAENAGRDLADALVHAEYALKMVDGARNAERLAKAATSEAEKVRRMMPGGLYGDESPLPYKIFSSDEDVVHEIGRAHV